MRSLTLIGCMALTACTSPPASAPAAPPTAPLAPELVQQAPAVPEPYPGFLDDVRALVLALPLGAPVRIEVLDLSAEGLWGRTGWDDAEGLWVIQLSSCACQAVLRDTLVHEWAHALVGDGGGPREPEHGAMWGVAYAAAYRALEERP